jgi:hypothetical protein
VYGGIQSSEGPKAGQMNSEVVASFVGIKPGDLVMFYVRNIGIYGLWKVTVGPFYDETVIWPNPEQKYPFRVCFEPVVREFSTPVALSDVLDLRDKGRVWTFDLSTRVGKSHQAITTEEGKELIRLLLRNNPIYQPPRQPQVPYIPTDRQPLPIPLGTNAQGELRYEGYLSAWLMDAFAHGQLRDVIGDYSDFINFVPTTFNKVMDIFATHVTEIDGVDILHKFTCIELKAGTVAEKDLNQLIMYESWLVRKLAQGDAQMVQSILIGHRFDPAVLEYRNKRKAIEEKTVRLLEYRVDRDRDTLVLNER